MRVAELLEAVIKPWKVENLAVRDMMQLLNTHCKASLADIQSGNVLYRGFAKMTKSRRAKIADSSTGERSSKDTNNLYQVMMDCSTHLSDVPSRSRSFICSGNAADASNYGELFVVVPFDNTPVAVINEFDMLHRHVSTVGTSVEELDSLLADLLVFEYGAKKQVGKHATVESINKVIAPGGPELFLWWLMEYGIFSGSCALLAPRKRDMIAETYERITGVDLDSAVESSTKKGFDRAALDTALRGAVNDRGIDLYTQLKERPTKMFNVLADSIFTKSSAGIVIQHPGELKLGRVEAWVSGKCVLIPIRMFIDMLETLKSQKALQNTRQLKYLKNYVVF